MTATGSAPDRKDEPGPVPLVSPRDGLPEVVADAAALERACSVLASGTGAVAVDTERASGYRYWPRAYLIQLRREGSGTVLIDPIALSGGLECLGEILSETEWVLHAASQDLPCLAELNLRPPTLFDTELAGRLAGFQRVSLGAMIEQLLGYQLEKGHSAADWSRRPLPDDWLNYAALDVELLLTLRDELEAELAAQGKLDWALQEFAAVRDAAPPRPRAEPWRRTSGIHKIRTRRGLAAVRALWQARDELGRQHDQAPGRILPDKAIVEAVLADPRDSAELHALSGFNARARRRHTSLWLRRLQAARVLPEDELPAESEPNNGPPPTKLWRNAGPDAAARLSACRHALGIIAERYRLPVENLLQPDLLRRLCWEPPEDDTPAGMANAMRAAGARPWQITLTTTELSEAIRDSAEPGSGV